MPKTSKSLLIKQWHLQNLILKSAVDSTTTRLQRTLIPMFLRSYMYDSYLLVTNLYDSSNAQNSEPSWPTLTETLRYGCRILTLPLRSRSNDNTTLKRVSRSKDYM